MSGATAMLQEKLQALKQIDEELLRLEVERSDAFDSVTTPVNSDDDDDMEARQVPEVQHFRPPREVDELQLPQLESIPLMPSPDSRLYSIYCDEQYRQKVLKKRRHVQRIIAKGDFDKAKRHPVFWNNLRYIRKNFDESERPGLLTTLGFYCFMIDLLKGFPTYSSCSSDPEWSSGGEDDDDDEDEDDDHRQDDQTHQPEQVQPTAF